MATAKPISSVTAQIIADDWGYDAVIIIGLKNDDIFVVASPKPNRDLSDKHQSQINEIVDWQNAQLFGTGRA